MTELLQCPIYILGIAAENAVGIIPNMEYAYFLCDEEFYKVTFQNSV